MSEAHGYGDASAILLFTHQLACEIQMHLVVARAAKEIANCFC